MSKFRPGARASAPRGAKSRRPRVRAPLSREKVLSTAVTLADRGGLESLSMRKLAVALRVEAMSLYNHVASRDDLLDGMVERVVSEIEAPEIGVHWKEAMRRRATSAHAVLRRHPWATALLVSRINVGPAMLHYIDATVGCLLEAGFSYALTDRAWNALDCHIYGFTLQEQNFPVEPEEYASAAQAFLPMLSPEKYPYMRKISEKVADGTHDGRMDFSFGLELILDGLERLLAAPPSG
ncbi:MAG TPA: TetR/AcrR family transcriptional regulator C-terminal domain-containing protein [Vicinamibacterales bacterium]|nr:TetR/AcrR family transcriptional regulator C-terminal domain-containing protein [Vicinamibacterales bacterium]